MKQLIDIQNELKAPKSQFNAFGKYKYRSCEDILEAVKPLLKKYRCYLTLSDKIVQVGDRYYIETTARISDETGVFVEVMASAREQEEKKGMDVSQITGSASSYARKYSLSGLFAIDDNVDADDTDDLISESLRKEIESCPDVRSISAIYNREQPKMNEEETKALIKLCTEQRRVVTNADN